MASADYPKVSIIIPTLNAGPLLDNCLASLAAQTYPRERLEILLADAFSKDATRDIAKKYGAIVIDDPGRNMEEGKRLALSHATGDYIVFVDADNELTHPDYLELAVNALRENPQALGVESYYLPSRKMSSFCAYVTHLLHISDPICWLMSTNPRLFARSGEVERWTLPPGSFSYPLGANGFVFRRTDLESVKANEHFQDTHVALHLMKAGKREWLRIRGRGVHHYYVQTWWGFLQKRRRATVHFLRVQQETSANWMKEKPPVPTWAAALYCVSIVGPLYHTLLGLIRDRDPRWLWHLPTSIASLLGVFWGMWTFRTNKGNRTLVADLRVKQELKRQADDPRAVAMSSHSPAAAGTAPSTHLTRPRLVCFVNGIFAEQIGGGDVYLAYMVRAAMGAGHPVHFFGGHALQRYLERQGFPLNLTLTDRRMAVLGDTASLPGQFRLLFDFARRLWGTLLRLGEVRREDTAYAMSDYWFDTIPLILCRSRAKILYLGMMAPTLRQVLFKGRADVTASRLASLYYWLSQQFSLRCFRFCRGGVVTYSHPEMRDYLLTFGYPPSALEYVPNGSDVDAANRVPAQTKQYDVAWTGRVHPQKGIDDLLALLVRLKERLPDFRAVIIGKSKDALEPRVRELGLGGHVTFSGMVSEEEKFRLLKASRVFVMPSRYESWGIVVGEALVADLPVVAYELDCYRPVFGDHVRYVKPFDLEEWMRAVEREVVETRAGRNYLAKMDVMGMRKSLSWTSAQERFRAVLNRMASQPEPGR